MADNNYTDKTISPNTMTPGFHQPQAVLDPVMAPSQPAPEYQAVEKAALVGQNPLSQQYPPPVQYSQQYPPPVQYSQQYPPPVQHSQYAAVGSMAPTSFNPQAQSADYPSVHADGESRSRSAGGAGSDKGKKSHKGGTVGGAVGGFLLTGSLTGAASGAILGNMYSKHRE